jgi:hypothetical protein
VPEGIETEHEFEFYSVFEKLLIVPEGIETTVLSGKAQLTRNF